MLQDARAFDAGAKPPDGGDMATQLGLQAEDAGEAIAALRQGGLVVAVGDGGLVPSRPLEKITLQDVRKAVAGAEPTSAALGGLVAGLVNGAEDAASGRLAAVTFQELCKRERGGRPAPRPTSSEGDREGEDEGARPAGSA